MKEQHGKGCDSPISTSLVLGGTPILLSVLCDSSAFRAGTNSSLFSVLSFGARVYMQLFLFSKTLAWQQLQQIGIKSPTNRLWGHPLSKGISTLISVSISSSIIHRMFLALLLRHFTTVCEVHLRKINVWPKNLVTVVSPEKAWHNKWKAGDVSEYCY